MMLEQIDTDSAPSTSAASASPPVRMREPPRGASPGTRRARRANGMHPSLPRGSNPAEKGLIVEANLPRGGTVNRRSQKYATRRRPPDRRPGAHGDRLDRGSAWRESRAGVGGALDQRRARRPRLRPATDARRPRALRGQAGAPPARRRRARPRRRFADGRAPAPRSPLGLDAGLGARLGHRQRRTAGGDRAGLDGQPAAPPDHARLPLLAARRRNRRGSLRRPAERDGVRRGLRGVASHSGQPTPMAGQASSSNLIVSDLFQSRRPRRFLVILTWRSQSFCRSGTGAEAVMM